MTSIVLYGLFGLLGYQMREITRLRELVEARANDEE